MDIRIASFDIGKKNFAFYVEDCNVNSILKLNKKHSSLPKKFQKKVKGPMNPYVEKIQNEMFKKSKFIDIGVFELSADELNIETRVNMHKLLETYRELWDTCDIIVIEQQYFNISGGRKTKGSEANVGMIKLAECCICWFIDRYWPFKEICYFGSMYKTQILGAPYKQTKPQRKKWAIEKGQEIFKLRGDDKIIKELDSKKTSSGRKQKQDDLYDCVIMTQAFKFRRMIM